MAVTTNLPSLDSFDQWYSTVSQGPISTATIRTPVEHNTFHLSEDGILYFGNRQFTAKHLELLDRLLQQEFPEEYI